MRKILCLVLVLLAVGGVQSHGGDDEEDGHDCGAKRPSKESKERAVANEVAFFGRAVSGMNRQYYAEVLQLLRHDPSDRTRHLFEFKRRAYRGYLLKDIPIVYHILPNQDNAAYGPPRATTAQLEHMTEMTNQLYNIYDKVTQTAVQWASFVTDQIIEHDDFISIEDCVDLSPGELESIVTKVDEWQFKFHTVICESKHISGSASLPDEYNVTDPLHSMILLDYRSIACFDESGEYLCEDRKGESHTRWWNSRSTVQAHEFGHLFGLYHTFEGTDCDGDGDLVSDTANENPTSSKSCPGLLPYDKDRDLLDPDTASVMNTVDPSLPGACGGSEYVCSGANTDTCAACCYGCPYRNSSNPLESITETENPAPFCCGEDETPDDTCPLVEGLDPKNNVMAYVPDYCIYELTPGQMARAMAQTRAEKTFIYCNYADVRDVITCRNVPCASTATSPNCDYPRRCSNDSACRGTMCRPRRCQDGACVSGVVPDRAICQP